MARGRKSEASLTVVPLLPGQGRPPAPRDLDRRERRVWRAVVGALPAHWLDLAGQQVLRRLVAQAVICERREVRLRELRAQGQDGSEEADALATLHSTSAKIWGSSSACCGLRRGRAWFHERRVQRSTRRRNPGHGRSKRVASPQWQDRKVTGADVIAFIETCLFVPEGQHVGKPLALQAWQKDWIRTDLRQSDGHPARHPEHAERKNAKTACRPRSCCSHLCGPQARSGSTVSCTRRRRVAIRPPSCSGWRPRWCG